ncbi:MAG: SWIM zinc finger family protein [Actinomycetota bacterium]
MSWENEFARKVKKAERYAREPDRLRFEEFVLKFKGDHRIYTITLKGENLTCNCPFFDEHRTCSHLMALKKILGVKLPEI